MRARLMGLFVFILMLTFCGDSKKENLENILARVGDDVITSDEFIKRAEFTIRPPYCRDKSYIHKKIVLNTIIAEKLFAKEEGEQSEILQHPRIQAYLKGRLEQSMRAWQYAKEVYDQVKLDTGEVKTSFQYAGRKYEIDYVNLNDSIGAAKLDSMINLESSVSLSGFMKEWTNLEEVPEREVEFNFAEHDSIIKYLYTNDVKKDDIIGPIKIDNDQYLMLQVKGWIDRPAITEQSGLERWKMITDRYHARDAAVLYSDYIKDVMKGKKIDFHKDIFVELTNLLGPLYIKSDKEKNEVLKKSYWDLEENQVVLDESKDRLKEIFDKNVFTFDGTDWTVEMLFDELMVHPLVFRKNKMKNREFGHQLQLAIMDVLTDKMLAEKAYQSGYDKVSAVTNTVNMFKDNLLADYHRKKVLEEHGISDSVYQADNMKILKDVMNPYVDSLQKKYSTFIEINTDLFEKIELTRTDLVAISPNDPYPVVVPNFPRITTDYTLDYGKKMVIDSSKLSVPQKSE